MTKNFHCLPKYIREGGRLLVMAGHQFFLVPPLCLRKNIFATTHLYITLVNPVIGMV